MACRKRGRLGLETVIDEYDIKLHPKESISLGALMLQEYPSRAYQPGTLLPDPNIHLIQRSMDISDSLFASSELLTLELLLPTSETPTETTIFDYHVSSIPYISQLSSMPPIAGQFPMGTFPNNYVLAIDNEENDLTTTAVQLICDKQKRAKSSSVTITLAWRRPSALTSIEEYHAFFDQVQTLLEPVIHHHEVFSVTTLGVLAKIRRFVMGGNRVDFMMGDCRF